jgi:hypothetical protein
MSPELAARQLADIKKLSDDDLLLAYLWGHRNPNIDPLDPVVKAVFEGRLLSQISDATKRLADSSDKMERLTTRLKNLTWILIFLTITAVIVPVGIETWNAYNEAQTAPVSAPPKPPQ